jgi:hypothetical protein
MILISVRRMTGALACLLMVMAVPMPAGAQDAADQFVLASEGTPATIYVDADADPAVQHAARNFAEDIGRVAGKDAPITHDRTALSGHVVIIGVVGQGSLVDEIVAAGKVEADDLVGEWEAFRLATIADPLPGISHAMVIAGSDRRGAVYGIYDMSERIGVSPWYWWADVPVVQNQNLNYGLGNYRSQPKVRYRGFFINDEDPALSGWARGKFGGVNADMYEHMFELLLRLKGNYLWPAMWGKSIAEDDPRSLELAAEMGIVLGTSHHEPLTRAHTEWDRAKHDGRAEGEWNYATNAGQLQQFWRAGMERFVDSGADGVITIGMRGDGDEAMSEDTAIPLLEQVVADQRKIIAEVTGKPAEETPQVWALYKEVQDYYDQGMRVPDDVILLFADDNWGQIRRLPPEGAEPRKGGYGVYYHFDYVGGPRSYKWLNYNQVEKTWQQMDLAWQRGARDLWVVNVGDLKPMEYPLSFFMAQAWDPERMDQEGMVSWQRSWSRRIFGPDLGRDISYLLQSHAQLAARRKAELVNADSFALGEGIGDELDGGEFGEMVEEWRRLRRGVETVKLDLDPAWHDAYFQLVEHPVLAMSNLYELYYAVAWNRRLAEAGDVRANYFADLAEELFRKDAEITDAYHALNGGKWAGMINQTHIGYTSWNDPPENIMPEVTRIPARMLAKDIAARIAFSDKRREPGQNYGMDLVFAEGGNDGANVRWQSIARLGRHFGAIYSTPQGQPATSVEDNVRVDFKMIAEGGPLKVGLVLVPTLDTIDQGGLRIGVSIDDGPVQVLTSVLEPTNDPATNKAMADWEDAVRNNAHMLVADFGEVEAGEHLLKLWRIDDNVVVQRIVVGPDPEESGYLGPPILSELLPPAPPAPVVVIPPAHVQPLPKPLKD